MRAAKLYDYIPEPQPVKSEHIIACHYYPGWKKGAELVKHNRFDDLIEYPERTPLLGYYDEENPEVCDWEIKWAVEHGINCFIHCWYRKFDNVGRPITVKDLRLGHGIHEAYFNCRFKKYMKFAIMWETDWGLISDMDDLVNHVIPFWVENYFRDEQYLTLDGKPVLYIYGAKNLLKLLGTEEKLEEMIALMHETMKQYGFPGIHISILHCHKWLHEYVGEYFIPVERLKEIGFDSIFQYCQQVPKDELDEKTYEEYLKTMFLDPQFVIEDQLGKIQDRIDWDQDFCMHTLSCMRDSRPWFEIFKLQPKTIMQYKLSPMEYKQLLIRFKEKIMKLPKDCIGRKIIVIDNWNEWAEGHYVGPCLEHGFQYLQAIRDVLTECDNLPDYRLPDLLEFGPYES